jgi:hypothetical protein
MTCAWFDLHDARAGALWVFDEQTCDLCHQFTMCRYAATDRNRQISRVTMMWADRSSRFRHTVRRPFRPAAVRLRRLGRPTAIGSHCESLQHTIAGEQERLFTTCHVPRLQSALGSWRGCSTTYRHDEQDGQQPRRPHRRSPRPSGAGAVSARAARARRAVGSLQH